MNECVSNNYFDSNILQRGQVTGGDSWRQTVVGLIVMAVD